MSTPSTTTGEEIAKKVKQERNDYLQKKGELNGIGKQARTSIDRKIVELTDTFLEAWGDSLTLAEEAAQLCEQKQKEIAELKGLLASVESSLESVASVEAFCKQVRRLQKLSQVSNYSKSNEEK